MICIDRYKIALYARLGESVGLLSTAMVLRKNPESKPGRPLSFDRPEALRRAMLLFWRHGYEATSVSRLCAEMGITPPSLYGAFGDKKKLFMQAVDLYLAGPKPSGDLVGEAPTARDAAGAMLSSAVTYFTGPDTPPGCLLAAGAATVGPGSSDVAEALAKLRRGVEGRLRTKIRRDVKRGVLPTDADPTTLAALTCGVIQGLSALARDGAGRPKLKAIAEASMRAWPENLK